jgi:hypothetical protein
MLFVRDIRATASKPVTHVREGRKNIVRRWLATFADTRYCWITLSTASCTALMKLSSVLGRMEADPRADASIDTGFKSHSASQPVFACSTYYAINAVVASMCPGGSDQ